jgi:hypothetical protein
MMQAAPLPLLALLLLSVCGTAQQTLFELPAPPFPDEAWDRYGADIANLGDVDFDGTADFAVAVEDRYGPLFIAARNYVVLYSGRDRTPLRAILVPPEATGLIRVAGAGDVDHDGAGDLVVGTPSEATGGSYAGSARVYSGRTGEVLFTHHGSGDDRLGWSVAGVGDVNDDGWDDYAYGVPAFDPSAALVDGGRVTVRSGKDGTLLAATNATAVEALGISVAGAGDTNLDGELDWVAGAPGWGVPSPERVRLISVSGIIRLHASPSGADLGAAVAGLGDLDEDGYDDYGAGAPYYDALFGSDAGRVSIWSGEGGAFLDELLGGSGERFGSALGSAPGLTTFDEPPGILIGAEGSGKGYAYSLNAGHTIVASFSASGPGEVRVAALGLNGSSQTYGAFAFGAPGDDTAAPEAGVVDVRWGAGLPLERMTTGFGASFGRSVALGGDMDGDGLPEVIVGMPFQMANGKPHAGVVRVYSGTTLRFERGGEALDQLGFAVSGLDDVTGDGVPDFLVGSPNSLWFGLRAGMVRVHSGATGLPVLSSGGQELGARYGAALAAVGDLDGDGTGDYAVGAPGAALDAGLVRAWSATGLQQWTYQGIGGELGSALDGIGDADLDGVPDVVVGSPTRIIGADHDAGYVTVHRGTDGVPAIAALAGADAGHRFGTAVAGPGDVNQDGRADFLAGAPGFESPGSAFPDHGRVELRSGLAQALLWSATGTDGERLGAALARAGDPTADGVPDLALGAPGGFGNPSFTEQGSVRVHSGGDFSLFRSFADGVEESGFGASLAGGADIDGDGRPDLVTGAPRTGADQAGAARALSTTALGVVPFGLGTAGCEGAQVLTLLQPLSPGASTELRVSGTAPGLLPTLVLSLGGDLAGSDPLASGALVHVDLSKAFAILPLPFPTGDHLAIPLGVPANPALTGLTVYAQEGFLWPLACPELPFALSSSTALEITLQ